jgi:hypothetical protein
MRTVTGPEPECPAQWNSIAAGFALAKGSLGLGSRSNGGRTMISGFADFTDLSTGEVVYVNPDAVRAISPTPDGQTIVQFDATHHIFVGGRVEEVMLKLREGVRIADLT